MRIHLTLEPSLFDKPAAAGPSSGPLAELGGEIVLIELQGELEWEGDKASGVVGVIGLDRPDKPTLHLGPHHLLHGKFANLPKPLAVIRRGVAARTEEGGAVQGDLDEEEEEEEEEEQQDGDQPGRSKAKTSKTITPNRPDRSTTTNASKRKANLVDLTDDEDEADDPPLFPEALEDPRTPARPTNRARRDDDPAQTPASSSPFLPASSIKDFSSELDFSSPPPSSPGAGEDAEEDGAQDEEERAAAIAAKEAEVRRKAKLERKRAERRAQRPERTRTYEVVGLVRRKVVFALRPEPIVTATILPE